MNPDTRTDKRQSLLSSERAKHRTELNKYREKIKDCEAIIASLKQFIIEEYDKGSNKPKVITF
jgi:hypothetical protein